MHEISWVDKHVPDDLRMALGDLVIVAADVKAEAYRIARNYRVPDPQVQSAKRILGKLEACVGDLGIPPWGDVERTKLLAWCHAARLLLQERDLLVHATMSIGRERPDGKSDTIRWSLRDNAPIDSEAHHVDRLVRLLLRVRRAGMIFEHGLLYPSAGGGRMTPEYVTFGRAVVPPLEVPTAWSEWAERANPAAGTQK
jgi:hypothetical protein